MADTASPVGTATWQADYIRSHLDEQSRYLETVSATDLMQRVTRQTHQLLDLKHGQTVLDVGCGNGVFLAGLAERVAPGGQVFGIDHAESFVEAARRAADASPWADRITVQCADAMALPWGDHRFDAAHCERVLMHLADPDAAIREMVRVVRPGGVIVAAEPDWLAGRFDHPDPEAFERVYRRALQQRQPDLGLTLHRRFGQAGLVDRRHALVTAVFTDLAMVEVYGLRLEPAVDALIAEGSLPAERLRAVVPALRLASAAGTYFSFATMLVVSGRVPGP